MGDGIYAAIAGASAQADRIDSIANNLANLKTVGFKADRPVFAEVLRAGLDQTYVAPRGTTPDLSQGPLKQTGNPLDLAVEGSGFLVVDTPQGERFTRAGVLSRNSEGQLVTLVGYPVLGRTGPILLPEGVVDISSDGMVTVGEGQAGQLKMMEPGPGTRLVKEAGNLFAAEDASTLRDSPNSRIHQGFVELSNVTATETLTQLISAQRAFTSLTTAVKTFKEMDSRLAREAKL